jgi:DNA-binding response OmpR family regulator
LRDAFRNAGYQTLEADGVEEAVELLSALGLRELGVVDAQLGMSACLDLLKRTRGDASSRVMRFMIVLSEPRTDVVMDALMGGFDDFLRRPLAPEALARKLRGLGLPFAGDRLCRQAGSSYVTDGAQTALLTAVSA